MDTLVINIESSTNSATQSIGKLISSLKNLQTQLDNTISKSAGLSNLKNIGSNIGTTSRTKQTNSQISTPSVDTQLGDLGISLDEWKVYSSNSSFSLISSSCRGRMVLRQLTARSTSLPTQMDFWASSVSISTRQAQFFSA